MRRGALTVAALTGACVAPAADRDADAGPPPCGSAFPGDIATPAGGALRGVGAGTTCAFLGVPYAEPPLGDLRWKAPQPAPGWSGVREARAFGPPCPQLVGGAAVGQESCLHLNLWAPAADAEPKPVIVFLHGGGNVSGAAAEPIYDGRWLAERTGALVVTASYRLGVLGFLAHPALAAEDEHGSSGNYGLLDQLAVLEWIHDEIGAFGGDAGRVIAFGQSAGGRNLCALAGSPLAAGLLAGVVVQSGACDLPPLADRLSFGSGVAAAAGCAGAADVAACLRGLDVESLLLAMPSPPHPLASSDYNPNVDGWLVPRAPLDALAGGEHPPLVVGSNADEIGRLIHDVPSEQHYRTLLEALFGAAAAPAVEDEYAPSAFGSARDALVAAVTDAAYTCAARRTARAAAGGDGAAYRYCFTHALAAEPEAGAFHGLELWFELGSFAAAGVTPSADELALSDALAGYLGRFAATANPNGDGAEPWPRYEPGSDRHLLVDWPLASADGVRSARCDFWDEQR